MFGQGLLPPRPSCPPSEAPCRRVTLLGDGPSLRQRSCPTTFPRRRMSCSLFAALGGVASACFFPVGHGERLLCPRPERAVTRDAARFIESENREQGTWRVLKPWEGGAKPLQRRPCTSRPGAKRKTPQSTLNFTKASNQNKQRAASASCWARGLPSVAGAI